MIFRISPRAGLAACRLAVVLGVAALLPPIPLRAQEATPAPPEVWSLHGQATGVYMGYPSFPSPYQGPNSLSGNTQIRDTVSATAFLGRRLWQGGALYFNPELNQGFGFNHTEGIAGFPNGEAQKASGQTPQPNVARLFLRQTFGLGGETETLAPDQNQLGETVDVSRITITAGKLALPDLFDDNSYSHDARTQFMNWALIDAGAWDYAADQRGYPEGVAVELNQKSWALRGGFFLDAKTPNGRDLETRIGQYGSFNVELEERYAMAGQPGKLRLLGFANRVEAGSFTETLANPAIGTDIAETRVDRTKYGFIVNLEQALNPDLGLFSRLSWNNANVENMSYTDITQSASFGASLKGTRWNRPDDTVGLAGVVDMLSKDERNFIAAGGTGILIGDGQLNYAPEGIVETYYSYAVTKPLAVSLDYQFIADPAYNRDRGPVSVFGVRVHYQF